MKLPIYITEKNGDVTACATVHEAEIQMELIDVKNSEYVVTDGDGLPVSISVAIEAVPVFWGLDKSHIETIRTTGLRTDAAPSVENPVP